jgi:hypothetical protein
LRIFPWPCSTGPLQRAGSAASFWASCGPSRALAEEGGVEGGWSWSCYGWAAAKVESVLLCPFLSLLESPVQLYLSPESTVGPWAPASTQPTGDRGSDSHPSFSGTSKRSSLSFSLSSGDPVLLFCPPLGSVAGSSYLLWASPIPSSGQWHI